MGRRELARAPSHVRSLEEPVYLIWTPGPSIGPATLAVIRSGIDPTDQPAVVKVVAPLEMDQVDGVMFLGGEDISEAIRGRGGDEPGVAGIRTP